MMDDLMFLANNELPLLLRCTSSLYSDLSTWPLFMKLLVLSMNTWWFSAHSFDNSIFVSFITSNDSLSYFFGSIDEINIVAFSLRFCSSVVRVLKSSTISVDLLALEMLLTPACITNMSKSDTNVLSLSDFRYIVISLTVAPD